MGMTLAEKVLAKKSGKSKVIPGEIVMAKVDCAMMDDILGPRVQIAEELMRLNAKIWDEKKVVVISDHYTPAATVKQAEITAFTRRWANEKEISAYFEGEGPCHQILAEYGFTLPGTLLVGTDSHTCTAGAFGCFGTGIGSTEMLGVLVTGEIWLKVPETIKIEWNGALPQGVMAKDIILKTIGDIGHAGATYMAMEFIGNTIKELSLDERMCITNMAVEAGAKAGLINPDEKTFAFFSELGKDFEAMTSDLDASYIRTYNYNSCDLEPQLSCPHEVDNVKVVKELAGENIDQAYIGSCTGGRYQDLAIAAKILKGKRIPKTTRLLISPASKNVWLKASRSGILDALAEAGAIIMAPSCGACLGLHSGVIASGETCISSTNRNFLGRMGSKNAEVYLASPATVAASALEGRIADPRNYL